MKKLSTLFLSVVMICCSTLLFAQHGSQHLTGADASKIYKGASKITISSKRNTISSIQLQPDQNIPTERSKEWLKNEVLKVPAEVDLIQYNQFNDKIGFSHVRYREHYKGVPVEYGVYYVHNKNGKVVSANGEWYNGINISTAPKISAQKAYTAACNNMNAKVWWHEEEETDNNKLMILPVEGKFTLVYKCDVSSLQPRNREWIYVDAKDGSIVKTESRIHETDVEGTAVTAYCGVKTIISDSFQNNLFRLHDYSRGAGVETFDVSEPNDFTSTTKDWDYFGGFDIYALDAHYGAEATYDYYNDNYGWKSVDGAGTQKLKSLVHAGGGINAFWDGTYMSYLDGDASNNNQPLTSLEVCGHELTHGVTEHSSGLVYSCESGGINESMSDIFGCTIRFLYTPFGTWYLGDQWDYIIRNMANPNEYSNPDCYDGTYWSNCPEVHSGSGVGNFWYYLMSDGGSGVNDVGNSYFVEGLGLVDAGAIAFRSNTVYLTPNSDYADLYDQSVLSAQDLFGGCSNQAVQTANAGYAVNIGGPFQDAVTAIFSPSQNQFCSIPATVTFNNGSLNGTDYLWDFGDGNTSTEMSPSHDYASVGDYTVTLIVNGVALCNTADTMVFSSINVQNIGQPIPPSCIPMDTQTIDNKKYGILNLTLADINNTSSNATEGYKDFSCSAFTQLVAGNPYVATIKVGSNEEDIRMWIDYSNDGIFDATELVYSIDDVTGVNTFILATPVNALLNTPIRVRIIDEKQTYDILDACYNPDRGQCEDYMVYFISPGAVPPVADFVANVTSVNLGGVINFTDLSQNVPTSWLWTFNGGTPSTSTLQYPTGIVYNTAGVYDVSLTATNANGSNTTTKVGYITVNPVITLCGVTETDLDGGVFYDSGGPSENYLANENCHLHIKPACAKSITVTFSSVSTSSSADVVNIYDGPDATAPLILTTYGNPFPYPTCTGTSGELYVTWNSDATGQSSGFGATWTSVVGGTVTPVTNYGASDFNPPYAQQVSFTDLSSNIPINWFWDFGDGNTSTLQNPSHIFSGSGAYNVSLTASNCGGSMTYTQIVTVQGAPVLVTKPQVIDVTIGCGVETVDVDVAVVNQGSGDLVYTLKEWEYSNQGVQPNILALTYGADLLGTYQSTIDAITAYYPNYTLATTTAQDAEGLAGALAGKNIFLITKPIGDPLIYLNYASTLNTFVNDGGVVILCGAAASKADCIFNTGLLSGAFGILANGNVLDVVNNTHPITTGFSNTIADGPKNTFAFDITNGDFNSLIEYTGLNVVGYRDLGLGHVVYLGFDFKNETYEEPKELIGNTMSWVNSMLIPDFVTIDPTNGGVLDPAATQVYTVHVDGSGLTEGTYQEYFVVTGNDPLNPNDTVWVNVTIGGGLCSSVIADVQCGGNVCFADSIGGGVTSVSYDFGDGNTSTTDNPCNVYTASGSYTVTSIICGANGCDTITNTVDIQLVSAIITSTGSYIENDPISFNSNSANANSWAWDFGDGGTSTLENPTHTYAANGIYSVTLTVTDTSGCTYVTSDDVVILVDAIVESHLSFDISLFPNPANGFSNLEYSLPNAAVVTVELWNGIGQKMETIISNQSQLAGKYSYSITMTEAGMYYVKMIVGDKTIWQKLVDVK